MTGVSHHALLELVYTNGVYGVSPSRPSLGRKEAADREIEQLAQGSVDIDL